MNIFVGSDSLEIAAVLRPEEERRIEAMLSKVDRAIAQALAEFLRRATSPDAVNVLVMLLEAGQIEKAVRFAEQYIQPVGVTIANALRAAGVFELMTLAPAVEREINKPMRPLSGAGGGRLPPSILAALEPLPRPSVSISFDTTNPRAVAAMRAAKDGFLDTFTETQREAIRATLVDALSRGQGPAETARDIRDVVGLSARQVEALKRYRRLLETGSSEALASPLRDKRYDGTVRKAGAKPIAPAKIDEMVEAYRRKMIKWRSEQIALDQSAKAFAAGREEGLRQVIEQSGIDPALITREWRSVRDRRVRHTHTVMDGQRTTLEGLFVSPSGARLRYPRDPQAPLDETAGCRCRVIHRVGGQER